MKGAVMVDVVRSEDNMLDGGHQGVEAEGLAVMEVHPSTALAVEGIDARAFPALQRSNHRKLVTAVVLRCRRPTSLAKTHAELPRGMTVNHLEAGDFCILENAIKRRRPAPSRQWP